MPLATPTLAVVDLANAGGLTATVASGDASATNELFSQKVNGDLGSAAWTSRGTRIGNGTISATVSVGYFWWHVRATLASETVVSNFVYQNLSDGLDSPHNRIIDGVKARLLLMALADIAATRVYKRWVALDDQLVQEVERDKDKFPIVLVCPYDREMDIGNLNAVDDIGYPVLVGVVDNNNQSFAANFSKYFLWRWKIYRGFRHQPLPGVSEAYNCEVEPLPIVDQERYVKNLFVTGMILRFSTREQRGLL